MNGNDLGQGIRSDCCELRELHNPPIAVLRVAGAILALLGVIGTIDVRNERDPRLWKYFRCTIHKTGGSSLLPRMKTLDPKNVTKDQLEMAKRFTEGLTMDIVRNTSAAACGLYSWVCKTMQKAEK